MKFAKEYEKLIETFAKLVSEKLGGSLITLVLYGSWARGDAKPTSDVDLLAILESPPDGYFDRLQPFLEAKRELQKSPTYQVLQAEGLYPYISCIVLSKREAKQNRYFFLDMVEDAKILYDKDDFFKNRLAELKKRLAELGAKRIFLEDGTWYWDLKPDLKPGEAFEL